MVHFFQVHALRMKQLLVFSVERDWCSVVQNLLDMPFEKAEADSFFSKLSYVMQDKMSLLHHAVRRKCRPMVELLLAYVPSSLTKGTDSGLDNAQRIMQFKLQWGNLIRPDMAGPAGLTPLHIAASMQGAEDVVDALTSDPCQVGLLAWFNTQDESGQTPHSLALLVGNVRSVQLVRAKVALRESVGGSVAINIPGESFPPSQDGRSSEALRSAWGNRRSASGEKLNAGKARSPCRVSARCAGKQGDILYSYIPKSFFLSLVLIATLCVCVSLVFKGPPPVKFVQSPFHWDGLRSGTQ
jgi:ankyrin repeat protein